MPTKPKLHTPALSRLEAVTDVASKQIIKLTADVEWYKHALGEKSAWADLESERADGAEEAMRMWKWITRGLALLALAAVVGCTALGFR